jgi:3-methyladenine DNA glycosylase Tag
MTVPTDQYTQLVQQGQEAVRQAVESWTRTVRDAAAQFPTVTQAYDPDKVIDQVFDFAEKLLSVQREFAKNVLKSSVSAAEAISDIAPQAGQFAESAGEAQEGAGEAAPQRPRTSRRK